MQTNKRLRIILLIVLVLTIVFSYLINRIARHSDKKSQVDKVELTEQEKIDSAARRERTKELREKALVKKKEKQERTINKDYGKKLTINGRDPATQSIIDPINLWTNYQTRTYAGKVRHGETVYLVRRDGDGVLIETKSGLRGWVTYWFIKEYKK